MFRPINPVPQFDVWHRRRKIRPKDLIMFVIFLCNTLSLTFDMKHCVWMKNNFE